MWSKRTMNPNTLGVFLILTNECCVLITRYTEDQLSLQSNLIDLLKYCNRSDEGLTLKKSAFKLFTVANLRFRLSC